MSHVVCIGLGREGVDVSEVGVVPGGRSPQSSILVADGGRAIVHFPGTLPRLELSPRALARCRDAAWVHVDHAGYAAAPRDVRLSIDGGNPIDGLDLDGVALYGPTDVALDAGAELAVAARV